MNEQIKAWLDSEEKDYETGLQLLNTFGKNRVLARFLGQKQSQANFEKLAYELSKLADRPFRPETVSKITQKPAAVTKAPSAGPQPTAPADLLEELTVEMGKRYNERCRLSNTLEDITKDEERAQVVAQILALQESYNALAVQKQYLEEHGKLPEAPAAAQDQEPVVDKAALIVDRDNMRSRVSKAKGNLKKDPENVEKQEKLAKLQVELNSVEMQIKLLK